MKKYFILLELTILHHFFVNTISVKDLCENQYSRKFCTSKSCIKAANEILNNLDESVDPCSDFYQFSCGGYLENKKIPEHTLYISTFSELNKEIEEILKEIIERPIDLNEPTYLKNAKKLYQSCMNEDFIEKHGEEIFKNYIKEKLGGWSLIDSDADMTKTHFLLNDFEFGSSERILLKEEFKNETLIKAYRNLIYKIATYLNPNINDKKKLIDDINRIIIFENATYNMSKQKEKDSFTYGETIDRTETFQADHYSLDKIAEQLTNLIKGDIDASRNTFAFENKTIELFQSLFGFEFGKKNSHEEIKNNIMSSLNRVMIWIFIKENINILPKKYQQAKLDFEKIHHGIKKILPREKLCINDLSKKMLLVMTRLFYQYKNITTNPVDDMYNKILNKAKTKFNELKWTDSYSTDSIKLVLEEIKLILANKNLSENSSALEFYYNEYNFNETSYFDNEIFRFKKQKNEFDLHFSVYCGTVNDLNAMFDHFHSKIVVSPGFLNPPFFFKDNPNYLNYGALGFILSHEIMHSLEFMSDSTEYWTEWTLKNFKNLTKCFEDQYDQYEIDDFKIKLNGSILLKENLADNGGLDIAFWAYKEWVEDNGEEKLLPGLNYNPNQLFFISFAQVWCSKTRISKFKRMSRLEHLQHAPDKFRVIGSIQNSEEFEKAFDCKNEKKIKKCKIW